MAYKVTKTFIPDLLVLEPTIYGDERGFFMETFNQRAFNEVIGSDVTFVQDNQSRSKKGVLRGLHFQRINPQGKLVRVALGSVFDVAVDLRSNSQTFGKWFGLELSEKNKKQFWIPAGFAHGFLVMSEWADFLYKTTTFYDPSSEDAIYWNDKNLSITWPEVTPLKLSKKDENAQAFDKTSNYFQIS